MKKKNKIILIAVNSVLLALIALCLFRVSALKNTLLTQKADEIWAGDRTELFAQVSCFFPDSAPATEEQILSFRSGINTKLADAGLESPETGSLWTDAYSASGSVSVKGERGTAQATAFGVGGNFFMFHPYELLDGSYIYENDLMNDRVVLDYELAWELFGSSDLEGMTITVNGTPCYIAGVIHRETDKFSTRTFSGEPLIFLSYSLFSQLTESTGATCYELACADPITGYAESIVESGLASDACDIVESTSRFDFSAIFSMFRHFGNRSIDTKAVAYPYWENAARVCEVYIARQYVFILLLALIPFATLVWLIVLLIKYLAPKLRRAKTEVTDAWDDRYATMDKMEKRRKEKKSRGGKHTRHKRKSKSADSE
jgi:hypothetical protein